MTRPTIEQVEDALAAVEFNGEDCGSVVVHILADELQALREEVTSLKKDLATCEGIMVQEGLCDLDECSYYKGK